MKIRPVIQLYDEDLHVDFSLHTNEEDAACLKYMIAALSYMRETLPYACLHIGMLHYPGVQSVKEMLVSTKAFIDAVPETFGGGKLLLAIASVEGEVKDDTIHAHVCLITTIPVDQQKAFHKQLSNYWDRLSMNCGVYTDVREIYHRQAPDFNLAQLASDEAIKDMVREISFCTKSGFAPKEAQISSARTVFVKFTPLKGKA